MLTSEEGLSILRREICFNKIRRNFNEFRIAKLYIEKVWRLFNNFLKLPDYSLIYEKV